MYPAVPQPIPGPLAIKTGSMAKPTGPPSTRSTTVSSSISSRVILGRRWVLKTGAHLWGLEHLLAKYPDARIVFTHRDPVKSMTSYASLTSIVRRVGSDHVDPVEVADDWTARLRRVLLKRIEVRRAPSIPTLFSTTCSFPTSLPTSSAPSRRSTRRSSYR